MILNYHSIRHKASRHTYPNSVRLANNIGVTIKLLDAIYISASEQ